MESKQSTSLMVTRSGNFLSWLLSKVTFWKVVVRGGNQNPLLDPMMLALLKEDAEKWTLV